VQLLHAQDREAAEDRLAREPAGKDRPVGEGIRQGVLDSPGLKIAEFLQGDDIGPTRSMAVRGGAARPLPTL
jgi:hypothetical protein